MGLRDSWIEERQAGVAGTNGNRNISQMHLARQGVASEEMQFVAKREKLEPELIRSEVARGRCIIPANIHHRNLEPMAIGIATKCKINANIGNSATSSNIDEELKKLFSEKARLESEIEQLKARKDQMKADEYDAALEKLLIELAQVNQKIKARQK